MRKVELRDVSDRLSELLEAAAGGESLLVTRDGEPLVTIERAVRPHRDASRRLGGLEGQFDVPDNWKEIGREEIERLFYGEEE